MIFSIRVLQIILHVPVFLSYFFESLNSNFFLKKIKSCRQLGCHIDALLESRPSYILEITDYYAEAAVFIVESDYFFNVTEYDDNNNGFTVPARLAWAITNSVCHTNGSSPSCRSKHSLCHNYTGVFYRDTPIGLVFDDLANLGHNCECSGGYQGNPYISHGCYGK
jgi:hypothetical protein